MSFRAWVPAVAGVLLLSECAAVRAQPPVPVRPRSSPFGNVLGSGFGGSPYLQQQQMRLQQGAVAPALQGGAPFAPGFLNGATGATAALNPNALPQVLPGAQPLLDPTQRPATGVVGTFNNLGHWYGGNYGHWYPNGVRPGSGAGALAGVSGGGRGSPAGGALGMTGGVRGGPAALLNSGFMAGATMNQFRR